MLLVLIKDNWSTPCCCPYFCDAWLQLPQQHKPGAKVLEIPCIRACTRTPLGTDTDTLLREPLQPFGTWVSWTRLTPGCKPGVSIKVFFSYETGSPGVALPLDSWSSQYCDWLRNSHRADSVNHAAIVTSAGEAA